MRSQAVETSGAGTLSPSKRQKLMPAPMCSGSTETINCNRADTPKPIRLPTRTPTIHFCPETGPRAGETSKRALAPLSPYPSGATQSRTQREIGFENWAFRHETVAPPARGRKYTAAGIVHPYQARVPSGDTVLELSTLSRQSASGREYAAAGIMRPYHGRVPSGDADSEFSTLSRQSASVVRWHEARAIRVPERAEAPDVRSLVASFVAPTITTTAGAGSAARRPAPTITTTATSLPQHSPLPPSHANGPQTLLELQDLVQRSHTPLAHIVGPGKNWGENPSPYSSGTTIEDHERRKRIARKFPAVEDSQGRARVYAREFVDAPVGIGIGVQDGSAEVAAREVGEEPAEKKEGKWKKLSGFLARKLKSDGKEEVLGPASSPPTPASPPSLIDRSPSNEISVSPTSMPVPQVPVPEPPVPVPGSPVQKASKPKLTLIIPPRPQLIYPQPPPQIPPISPLHPFELAFPHDSGPVSPLSESKSIISTQDDSISLAQLPKRTASRLGLRKEYDELLVSHRLAAVFVEAPELLPQPLVITKGEEKGSPLVITQEKDKDSPLSPLEAFDADLFSSPLVITQRWKALYEAVAEACAAEDAAADWGRCCCGAGGG